MFGKRCSLCGGKLNGQMICTECGLNNSKSEKYYKINKSSCDRQPLTHVHEEEKENRTNRTGYEKTKNQQYTGYGKPETGQKKKQKEQKKKRVEQYTWQGTSGNAGKQRRARWAGRAVTAFIVLSILGTVVGSIGEMVFDGFTDSGDGYEERDPYETAFENGYELSEDGEEWELELTSGKYIVGVHIPEGRYEADGLEEYDVVKVNDRERSIYLYEYPAKEGTSYLDDIRLFDGALLEITAQDTVYLRTENGLPVVETENPLTESFELKGNTEKTAGIDFEAGVYDLKALNGYGSIEINIYDEDETGEDEPFATETLYIGKDSSEGTDYKNVILPKGARVVVEAYDDGGDETYTVQMTPSPVIESTDYLQTYKEIY